MPHRWVARRERAMPRTTTAVWVPAAMTANCVWCSVVEVLAWSFMDQLSMTEGCSVERYSQTTGMPRSNQRKARLKMRPACQSGVATALACRESTVVVVAGDVGSAMVVVVVVIVVVGVE